MKVILTLGGVLIGICTFCATSCSSGFSDEWRRFRNMAYSKNMSISVFVVPLSRVNNCFTKADTGSNMENLLFTKKELKEYSRKKDPPYIVIKIENLGRRGAWGRLKFRLGKGRYRVIDVLGPPKEGYYPEFFVLRAPAMANTNEVPVIDFEWESLYAK